MFLLKIQDYTLSTVKQYYKGRWCFAYPIFNLLLNNLPKNENNKSQKFNLIYESIGDKSFQKKNNKNFNQYSIIIN